MKIQNITIDLEKGLYTRLATKFCHLCSSFKCNIWLERDHRRVDGKSLLGVMSLGLKHGTDVRVIVDGFDESKAIDTLATFLKNPDTF